MFKYTQYTQGVMLHSKLKIKTKSKSAVLYSIPISMQTTYGNIT